MPMQLDPSIILNSDHDRIVLGQRELDQRKREGDARIAVDQQEAELRRQEILARREEIIQRALERNQPKEWDPGKANQALTYQQNVAKAVYGQLKQVEANPDTWVIARRNIGQLLGPEALTDLPEDVNEAMPSIKMHIASYPVEAEKANLQLVTHYDPETQTNVQEFVAPTAGTKFPQATPKATGEAKPGTLEYYMTSTYGQNPTPEQQRQGRKDFNQSDDKATNFAAGDVTKLTPAGIDLAAVNLRKRGVMIPLGMGDKSNRQAIINRAATLTDADIARIEATGADIAGNAANYGADAGSLKKLQQQRDAITAFENTAQKNIDIFLETAGKVVDTGSPMANSVARVISGKMLGSPDQVKYDAARQVALSEIARIVQNPNLTGQLSDSARQEIEVFNPSNATLAQSVAVMRLLKRDMANRKQSLDDALKDVRGRIGGGSKKTEESDTPRVPGLSYQDYQKSRGKK